MLGRSSIFAAVLALAASCGFQSAHAQGVFTLSSTGFKDGERLPTKFAGNNKSNPNCVGENISPAFSWTNPPEGAKSFAFLMIDLDGRPPVGVVQTTPVESPHTPGRLPLRFAGSETYAKVSRLDGEAPSRRTSSGLVTLPAWNSWTYP